MITPTLCVPPPLADEESVSVAARASGPMGAVFRGDECHQRARHDNSLHARGRFGADQAAGRGGSCDERSILRAAYFAERCLREAGHQRAYTLTHAWGDGSRLDSPRIVNVGTLTPAW